MKVFRNREQSPDLSRWRVEQVSQREDADCLHRWIEEKSLLPGRPGYWRECLECHHVWRGWMEEA